VADISGKVNALESQGAAFNERIIQGSMATQRLRNEKEEADRGVEEVREGLGNMRSQLLAQQGEVVETRKAIKVLSKIAKSQVDQKKSSDAKLDAILAMLAGQGLTSVKAAEEDGDAEWSEGEEGEGSYSSSDPKQVMKEMVQESLEEAMARASSDLDRCIQEADAERTATKNGRRQKKVVRSKQAVAAGLEEEEVNTFDLTRPTITIDLAEPMAENEEVFTTGSEPVEEAKQARAGMKAAGRGDKAEKVDEAMEQKAESREAMINQLRSKVPLISEEEDPEKPGSTEVPDDDNPSPDGLRRRKGQ
jgi:hypothetical protein